MKILITSIGSFGLGPSLVKNLRLTFEKESQKTDDVSKELFSPSGPFGDGLEIYGMDVTNQNAAMHLVDHAVVCPPYGPEQIKFVYDVCKKEQIDIVIPLSADHELLPLIEWNEKESVFNDINTIVVGMDSTALNRCVEKDKTYEWLIENNLFCAEYYTPQTIEEFKEAVQKLGYPQKKVLIKPITGAGNRGLRVLDSTFDEFASMVNEKPDSSLTTFESYLHLLEKGDEFPGILVMEYLTGKEYTVYCLADHGKPLYIVPLERVKTTAGMSLIAQVDLNKDVIDYATWIIKEFDLHSNVDLQLKFNEKGDPVLYEINPRYSASIILPYAAGVNLAYFGILQALGKDVPQLPITDGVQMIRYAEEVFVDGDTHFRLMHQ